jgi:hypothetical protein
VHDEERRASAWMRSSGDASANFSGSSSKNALTTIGWRIQLRNSGPIVSLRFVKS